MPPIKSIEKLRMDSSSPPTPPPSVIILADGSWLTTVPLQEHPLVIPDGTTIDLYLEEGDLQ